jgi:hypothetical protein
MSQKINVKMKDPRTGKEMSVSVGIIRSWVSPAGTVRLRADNGNYVDGNCAPIQFVHHLDIISDKNQRAAAQRWWSSRGEAIAKAYYSRLDTQLAAMSAGSAVDAVEDAKYYRVSHPDGKMEGPFSWAEFFPTPPAWWGRKDIGFDESSRMYVKNGISIDTPGAKKDGNGDSGGAADGVPVLCPEIGDPNEIVTVTVFKDSTTRRISKRYTGPFAETLAEAKEWLASKQATGDYDGARIEVSVDDSPQDDRPSPSINVHDGEQGDSLPEGI